MVTRFIEPDVVAALLSYDPQWSARLPRGIFLPAERAVESELLNQLTDSWASLQWSGLGTWMRRSPEEPNSFAVQYEPGLVRRIVADSVSTMPRGITARSQWAVLDVASPAFPQFLAATRRAGGVGNCVVVTRPEAETKVWYAPSLSLAQRSMLTFEQPPGLDVGAADARAALSFLAASVSAAFAIVLQLNLHPWGGYVVLGHESILSDLFTALPDVLSTASGIGPIDVLSSAGGIAF